MCHRVAHRLGAASLIAAVLASLATAGGASAEVKKMMSKCPGQKLCAWYLSTVTPPKGWVLDSDSGERNQVTILLPDKDDLDFNDPMIYVQTSLEPGPDTLDAIIAVNQAQWRKREPKVSITPAGTVPRASGAEAFKLFLYRNPDKPKQAFETVAYGFAIQPNGERYFLTVVDTAASKAAIDRSNDDFLAVLKGL
jgi:hypothetical protein